MKKLKLLIGSACIVGMFVLPNMVSAEDQSQGIVTKSNYDSNSKTFDVTVTKSTNGMNIKKVDVGIWSEENGQDDLKWYSTTSISNGQAQIQFNLANHGNRAGNYITHVYTTYSNNKRVGTVLKDTKVPVNPPKIELQTNGIKILSDPNAPSNGTIYHAVWSEENGQDDIKWYTASSSGSIVAEFKNHKGYGKYHIHTYLNQDGKLTGISAQSIMIDSPNISSQIISSSDKVYTISVNNVPEYMSSIMIPVWSEVNGQDDIKWYTAQKLSSNSYQVIVKLGDHGFDLGTYHAHIYGQNILTKRFEGLGVTSGFQIDSISGLENPTVKIENANTASGIFTVTALKTAMSKRMIGMKVNVTSKNNPQNSKVYESKPSASANISQTIDLKSFGTAADDFSVRATITYSDNSTATFNLNDQSYKPEAQQTAPNPKITTYINEINTYPKGYCTWAVKELAPWIPNRLGNAGVWAGNAQSKGFRIGSVPKVGSIAVWPNDGGGYGHVAYVTHVESSTRIQVKESNYAGKTYISNFRGWFNPLDSFWGGSVTYIYSD